MTNSCCTVVSSSSRLTPATPPYPMQAQRRVGRYISRAPPLRDINRLLPRTRVLGSTLPRAAIGARVQSFLFGRDQAV